MRDPWRRENPVGMNWNSEESAKLSATWNQELHEVGLAFGERYPTNPLRWDVWMMVNRAVFFGREVIENGEEKFAQTTGINNYPTWLQLSRAGRSLTQTSAQREILAASDRELLIKDEPMPRRKREASPAASLTGAERESQGMLSPIAQSFFVDFATPVNAAFQSKLAGIDARLRGKYGITADQTSVGVLDLLTQRLALVRPDAIDYAASVPKLGILLAWFQSHPEASTSLDSTTRQELGRMIKVSDNQMATKYSSQLGITRVQAALNSYGLYDAAHGGGIWFGKHYGSGGERIGDPVGGHSHAATVRQLVRYYLLLEQGKLVSPEVSRVMREIFASPRIAHRDDLFVKGLAGRKVEIRRKSGSWETWSDDTAVVTGPGRHYIIVGLTHHAKGTAYLEEFAAAVDDLLSATSERS